MDILELQKRVSAKDIENKNISTQTKNHFRHVATITDEYLPSVVLKKATDNNKSHQTTKYELQASYTIRKYGRPSETRRNQIMIFASQHGDYNLPTYKNCDDDRSILLHEFLNFNNLIKYNDIKNSRDRCLDLLISNYNLIDIHRAENMLVAEDPHHPAIEFHVPLKDFPETKATLKKQYAYDYRKGNFTLLYQLIKDYNRSDLFEYRNVDDCLDLFYKIIYSMLDQAIPKYVVEETAHKPKYPFWYSPDLVRKIRNKNHLHKLIQKIELTLCKKNS
ncbi:hypothetical protein JTB14_033259 [Gonioctena quinquepunctata]|nr:hypothetical protein JTB14_033259 [Gonioctena quinquepunctata]